MLSPFLLAYCEAIDFTEADNLGAAEFSPDMRARIARDCAAFEASPAWQAALEAGADSLTHGGDPADRGAHDFWLTRNGHGAGFWDGDWTEPHASALDAAAKAFGGCDAYVGDDGLAYLA